MKHLFKNDSIEVEYDTTYNCLFVQGKHIFTEEKPVEIYSGKNKSSKPLFVRIKMGHNCNMSCSYCLQEPLGDKSDVKKPAIDFSLFPDLSKAHKVELWGGEPLIYWEAFKQIVEQYDRPDIEFMTVTNGTLLRDKHYQFMANTQATWSIAVSHDGPLHTQLRGKDCLENLLFIETLYRMRDNPRFNVLFNCTISEQNYDVHAVVKYLSKHNIPVNFEIITGYDENSKQYVLDKNKEKHQQSIEDLFNDKEVIANSIVHFERGIKGRAESFKTKSMESSIWGCGVDDPWLISIDMKGNYIICPSVVDSYGKIGEEVDISTAIPIKRKDKCHSCPVVRLCKGGCPLNEYDINCSSKFAHYIKILELALDVGLNQTGMKYVKR